MHCQFCCVDTLSPERRPVDAALFIGLRGSQRARTDLRLVATFLSAVGDVVMYRSGSVCLDVINQTWSPMYDLKNIFDIFLPQLLTYPNPTDPLNGEAAALQLREPERYEAKVKDMVAKYAKPEDYPQGNTAGGDDKGDGEDNEDDSDFDDDGGGSMSTDDFGGGKDGTNNGAGGQGSRDACGAGPSAPDSTFDL